jgi:N-methylhydantoinase A
VLVPRYPGVLSAMGMLTAPEALEVTQGLVLRLDSAGAEPLARARMAMESELRQLADTGGRIEWRADTRYAGQAHELIVEISAPTVDAISDAFHSEHDRRFGFAAPAAAVELVTLRARAVTAAPPLPSSAPQKSGSELQDGAAFVVRDNLGPGDRVRGPVAIVQTDATTYIPEGWAGLTGRNGHLVLERDNG